MKNQELFDRTINILVKAYQNETLAHNEACACAIGNMIAGNNGFKIIRSINSGLFWDNEIDSEWTWVHCNGEFENFLDSDRYVKGKSQLESTGYSINETILIERAFEYHSEEVWDEDGFKGLMSVVDALILIHSATTTEAATAKSMFVKELTI